MPPASHSRPAIVLRCPTRHVIKFKQACGLLCELPKKRRRAEVSAPTNWQHDAIGTHKPLNTDLRFAFVGVDVTRVRQSARENFRRCLRLPQNSKETLCLGICTKRLPSIMSRPRKLIGLPRSSTEVTITRVQSSNQLKQLISPKQLTSIRPRLTTRASSRSNLMATRNRWLRLARQSGPPFFARTTSTRCFWGICWTAFAIKLEANNGHQAAPKKRGKK